MEFNEKESVQCICYTQLYLFQLLGNAHTRVHSLSALSEFSLIVFEKVASGELCCNEACQRWTWNSVRTPVLSQGHCQQQSQPQVTTQ